MYNRLVLFGLLIVLCSSVVGKINGQPNDELRSHPIRLKSSHSIRQKDHRNDIRHNKALGIHQGRHHYYEVKTRQGNGNLHHDDQLAAVASWLNGTKELQFLYNILPSCIARTPRSTNNSSVLTFPLLGNTTSVPEITGSFPFFGTNGTSSMPVSNTSLGFPIFECLARRALNITKFPEFTNIWKDIFLGLNDGCNKTEILKQIKEFFGINGTFWANLFNITFWEHTINSPANAIFTLLEHHFESN